MDILVEKRPDHRGKIRAQGLHIPTIEHQETIE
jgi:hypothetical protein